MKYAQKVLFLALFLATCSLTLNHANAQTDVIAFWNFNDANDPGVPDETIRIDYSAVPGIGIGAGTVYMQRADTDGNGKGGNAFTDAVLGLNESAGRSIAWDDFAKGGSDNDAELFISTSTIGYENIVFSFDVQGNAELDGGFNEYDVKFDTQALVEVLDPETSTTMIVDFAGGISTDVFNNQPIVTSPDSFDRFTLDFSGFAAVNNQANFSIRLDDFSGNDDVRFDNFLITGTPLAVPEPGSLIGMTMVALGFASRRRRRN